MQERNNVLKADPVQTLFELPCHGSYLGTIYRPGSNHYSGCQWRIP